MKNIFKSILGGMFMRRSGYRQAVTISVILFTIGMFFSVTLSMMEASRSSNEHNDLIAQQLENSGSFIEGKLALYEQVLLSTASFVNVNGRNNIDDKKWYLYAQNIQLTDTFPDVMGLGLADFIKSGNVEQYTETVKQSGLADFEITPSSPRAEYTSIRFLAPATESNRQALGFDMFSEPNRNQAMAFARDNGTFGLTRAVVAVQDQNRPDKRLPLSLLMYYPVYQQSNIPPTLDERQQQLVGYVYMVFRIEDMLRELKTSLDYYPASLQLIDVSSGGNFLYGFTANGKDFPSKVDVATQTLTVANRQWKLDFDITRSRYGRSLNPIIILFSGSLISILGASGAFVMLQRRVNELQQTHELALQRTKDELLALASHQLRTPASGVRQYIDMLRQGYFGDLTEDQVAIATKAYDANELQLSIIDQILYVAKADAGQLIIDFEPINLAALVKSVIEGFMDDAGRKNIKLNIRTKDTVMCEVDPSYMRMIVENLISNAIKYSYPNTGVTVSIRKKYKMITLTVKDRGVGIADEDTYKLFRKFSRIENPLSRIEGGSGLGLFLVDKLVQAHRGSIQVSSVPGKGSVFRVSLPCNHEEKDNVVQFTD